VAIASKSTGSASAAVAPVGWVGGTKIDKDVSQTGQIQHLRIEFENESQMVLLSRRNGGGNARQSGHKQFVICPQLKSVTFTEMAKMPNSCMCSQQSRSNME
jgi:hypothetical protein